jgi:hypothetical protein
MEVPAASPIVTLSYSSRFTEEVSAASPTLTDGWGDAQDNGLARNNHDNDEKDGCGDMDCHQNWNLHWHTRLSCPDEASYNNYYFPNCDKIRYISCASLHPFSVC